MATKAAEEEKRARRAFFLIGGIRVFRGDLIPLSSRSVVEVCVMPIVLYGCESASAHVAEIGAGGWMSAGLQDTAISR